MRLDPVDINVVQVCPRTGRVLHSKRHTATALSYCVAETDSAASHGRKVLVIGREEKTQQEFAIAGGVRVLARHAASEGKATIILTQRNLQIMCQAEPNAMVGWLRGIADPAAAAARTSQQPPPPVPAPTKRVLAAEKGPRTGSLAIAGSLVVGGESGANGGGSPAAVGTHGGARAITAGGALARYGSEAYLGAAGCHARRTRRQIGLPHRRGIKLIATDCHCVPLILCECTLHHGLRPSSGLPHRRRGRWEVVPVVPNCRQATVCDNLRHSLDGDSGVPDQRRDHPSLGWARWHRAAPS